MRDLSPQRRSEILDALRRGTVPSRGLGELAVGLDRFAPTLDEIFETLARGQSVFKAVRGDYGCGKTFFARWIQERARDRSFATSEVQISETETPLHRLETVYRRLIERLGIPGTESGAFRQVIDAWFYALEEDVLAGGDVPPNESELLLKTTDLMEKRLQGVSKTAPAFAASLRGYRDALAAQDIAKASGLLSWVGGQPHVAATLKRDAGIKGEVDHFAALSFLQALLIVLRDSGHPGLVLVLDEVETLQRVRSDAREKGLNALRQFIDEIDSGRFPGLCLIVTGTPTFFDGPQGIKKCPPLAQRLHTDFDSDSRFDNPRAPQIRLPAFSRESLLEVGMRVRDIFSAGSKCPERIMTRASDDTIARLADAIAGSLGGKVGVAPRLFLKKLVADILDRIELYDDFDPAAHYKLTLSSDEMTEEERNLTPADTVEGIALKW